MNTYILRPLKPSGKTLYPNVQCGDRESAHATNEFCLDGHVIRNEYGKPFYRYRFHTQKPYRFFDTLEFDIKCPKCGSTLRLCGNPYDLNDHGLYKCSRCDGEM